MGEIDFFQDIALHLAHEIAAFVAVDGSMEIVDDPFFFKPAEPVLPAAVGIEPEHRPFLWNNDHLGLFSQWRVLALVCA